MLARTFDSVVHPDCCDLGLLTFDEANGHIGEASMRLANSQWVILLDRALLDELRHRCCVRGSSCSTVAIGI